MIYKDFIIENIKTLLYALFIAIVIRSILVQPFYIPSSSMEPNLLVGDRLFVSKYSYGYSKHSFPFSPPVIKNRIFFSKPERGDVVVFKTPSDNRTDYIKRLIGLPGDSIQFIDGNIYLNNNEILKSIISRKEISDSDFAVQLFYSSNIIFVPGYGLAVAQAQKLCKEIQEILEKNDVVPCNRKY